MHPSLLRRAGRAAAATGDGAAAVGLPNLLSPHPTSQCQDWREARSRERPPRTERGSSVASCHRDSLPASCWFAVPGKMTHRHGATDPPHTVMSLQASLSSDVHARGSIVVGPLSQEQFVLYSVRSTFSSSLISTVEACQPSLDVLSEQCVHQGIGVSPAGVDKRLWCNTGAEAQGSRHGSNRRAIELAPGRGSLMSRGSPAMRTGRPHPRPPQMIPAAQKRGRRIRGADSETMHSHLTRASGGPGHSRLARGRARHDPTRRALPPPPRDHSHHRSSSRWRWSVPPVRNLHVAVIAPAAGSPASVGGRGAAASGRGCARLAFLRPCGCGVVERGGVSGAMLAAARWPAEGALSRARRRPREPPPGGGGE